MYLQWIRKEKLNKYLSQIREHEKPLFIHINKTAGSSIANSLGFTEGHYTLREIEVAYSGLFGEELPLDTEIWTAIRNPFEKVVSQYFFRVQQNQNQLKTHTLTFDEWVKAAYDDKDLFYRDREIMFIPQHRWIESSKNYPLQFIRFENLQQDYLVLAERYHGNPLVWKKKSSHKNYREHYSSYSRAIIAREFEEDLLQFNYTF